jgi:hypothetical protein
MINLVQDEANKDKLIGSIEQAWTSAQPFYDIQSKLRARAPGTELYPVFFHGAARCSVSAPQLTIPRVKGSKGSVRPQPVKALSCKARA